MGWYVLSVEGGLFAPQEWYFLSNILTPLRMALIAWTVLSVLLILESLTKKPPQLHELLTRGVSLLISLPPTYAFAIQDIRSGVFWTLTDQVALPQRALIGLVFAIGLGYVLVSPWIERDRWVKVGEVSIDTGTLLLTDPARIDGELPPLDEIGGLTESSRVVSSMRIEGLKKPKGWTDEMGSHACQILFKEGHEGAGVTVHTGAGDGQYFVYARLGKIRGLHGELRAIGKDRVSGVKVEFTPWRPNKEPPRE